jgi:FAD/FMN-containing dehydrogenase
VRDTYDALTPKMAESVYVNYLADDDNSRVQAAYGPNWERLRQVKRAYDPDNVFYLNQNIAP